MSPTPHLQAPVNLTYKYLIVGPSWVGDMVMAQSLFMMLKQIKPNCSIDVLAPAWSRPIIERMPEVNKAIDMPIGHGRLAWSERRKLGHKLRASTYDQAIVLPNSWKSALIPWFAKIPLRTGWLGEARYGLLNDARKLNKAALPLMVQRFISLAYDAKEAYHGEKTSLKHCPAPALVVDTSNNDVLMSEFSLNLDKPVLILCPGAEFGSAKQWPAEHYAELAREMISKGWQVWILGSAGDIAISEAIENNVSTRLHIHNLCGKTSLEQAIDLMSLANQVVSNDSGLMHIASALNKPLAALYGATSPKFTPPLSPTAQTVSIKVDCGPCFKRECPLSHHRCMRDIAPNRVLQLISE